MPEVTIPKVPWRKVLYQLEVNSGESILKSPEKDVEPLSGSPLHLSCV